MDTKGAARVLARAPVQAARLEWVPERVPGLRQGPERRMGSELGALPFGEGSGKARGQALRVRSASQYIREVSPWQIVSAT